MCFLCKILLKAKKLEGSTIMFKSDKETFSNAAVFNLLDAP